MKLLVLGATGGIGRELIRQAIDRGHSVTAFVRNPASINDFGKRICIEQGDLLDSSALARVIAGNDAVLSAFGPRVPLSKSDANLLGRFASSLVTAMSRTDVRRVIVVSTAFLFKDAVMPPANLFGRIFFAGIVDDATAMEDVICKSGLDWTIVRPPRLVDKPLSLKYRVLEGRLPGFGFTISRADTADFMLKAAEKDLFSCSIVGISR